MGNPSREHGRIQVRLAFLLESFVQPRELGEVVTDAGFLLSVPGKTELEDLAPDVAFIAAGRGAVPGTPAYKERAEIAPDLAVEITSPHQFRPEMEETVGKYLAAGTRLAWIVYPSRHEIQVWRPGEAPQTVKVGETLEGWNVLPGFMCLVAEVFPDIARQRRTPPQPDQPQDGDREYLPPAAPASAREARRTSRFQPAE